MGKKQKVLITGGSGLLGQHLNNAFNDKFDILTLYNYNQGNCALFNSLKIDLLSREAIAGVFNDFKPDTVVHTAAIANPQKTELVPSSKVFETNVLLTEYLAKLCDKHSARLVYTSTDLVYAGYKGGMLKEDAKLVPMSLYAETKLIGEMKIKAVFGNYLILRTVLLLGRALSGCSNSFHQIVLDLKNNKPVDLFTDQFRSPLTLSEAARILAELVAVQVSGTTINFTGPERVSRVRVGEIVCEYKGYSKNLLNGIKMHQKPGTIPVADVSLDSSRLNEIGIKLRPFDACLHEEIDKILSE